MFGSNARDRAGVPQRTGVLTPTDKGSDKEKDSNMDNNTSAAGDGGGGATGAAAGGGDGDGDAAAGDGDDNNGGGDEEKVDPKVDHHEKDKEVEEEEAYFYQEDPAITAQRGVVYLDGLGDIVDIQAPLPKVELSGDIAATVSQLAHYSIVVTTFERCASEWRIANQVHTPITHLLPTHPSIHTFTHPPIHSTTHLPLTSITSRCLIYLKLQRE